MFSQDEDNRDSELKENLKLCLLNILVILATIFGI